MIRASLLVKVERESNLFSGSRSLMNNWALHKLKVYSCKGLSYLFALHLHPPLPHTHTQMCRVQTTVAFGVRVGKEYSKMPTYLGA